jgi:prevent-host-death family protein
MAEETKANSTLAMGELDPHVRRLVEQVRATKRPVIITEAGESAVVLVDAEQYGQQQRRLALLERIAQAKEDIAQGRTHTQEEAEALIDEWFGCSEKTPD